jgi:hypothetical protein
MTDTLRETLTRSFTPDQINHLRLTWLRGFVVRRVAVDDPEYREALIALDLLEKAIDSAASRDQAREAEIRGLIAEWRQAAQLCLHRGDTDAVIVFNMCATRLESLLTPPQEREQ